MYTGTRPVLEASVGGGQEEEEEVAGEPRGPLAVYQYGTISHRRPVDLLRAADSEYHVHVYTTCGTY